MHMYYSFKKFGYATNTTRVGKSASWRSLKTGLRKGPDWIIFSYNHNLISINTIKRKFPLNYSPGHSMCISRQFQAFRRSWEKLRLFLVASSILRNKFNRCEVCIQMLFFSCDFCDGTMTPHSVWLWIIYTPFYNATPRGGGKFKYYNILKYLSGNLKQFELYTKNSNYTC